MNSKIEKKLLQKILNRKRNGIPRILASQTFLPIVWLILVAIFLAAFRLSDQLGSMAVVVVILSAFGGLIGGAALHYAAWARQWPAIDPHIDEESLAARIHELET